MSQDKAYFPSREPLVHEGEHVSLETGWTHTVLPRSSNEDIIFYLQLLRPLCKLS